MLKFICALISVAIAICAAVPTDVPMSTGYGLAQQASDPNWTYSFGGSKAASTIAYQSAGWLNFSKYANWIAPPLPANGASYAAGDYTFTTTFNLEHYDPSMYMLTAAVSSDDFVKNVTLNGIPVAIPPNCPSPDQTYDCTVNYKFSNGFVSGTNTIQFTVNNIVQSSGLNPCGLWVQFNA